MLSDSEDYRLTMISREIRKSVVQMLAAAGSGHLGGSLGLADIFTALYFHILHHDPAHPDLKSRDRMILSIGHVAPVLYATLARAGYFPVEELKTLRQMGSRLQGHPGRDHGLPGIELSAGSLGQGLSVAVGMALAAQMDGHNHRIFCIMGDGELQEGSVWEAAMSAAHHKLGNLTAIIDRNGLQIDGPTENVLSLEPLGEKWRSFGWQVIQCNGHDFQEIVMALEAAGENRKTPCVVIAKTLMGRGIPEIEGNFQWHGKAPSPSQAEAFLTILDGTV